MNTKHIILVFIKVIAKVIKLFGVGKILYNEHQLIHRYKCYCFKSFINWYHPVTDSYVLHSTAEYLQYFNNVRSLLSIEEVEGSILSILNLSDICALKCYDSVVFYSI